MKRSPTSALTLLASVIMLGLPSPVVASDCFDHYNPQAWDGEGLAMVLCRNNSDDSSDTWMTGCELRYHGGARIQGLSRHGNLDNGRVIYTDYNTTGDHFNFDIDIVCQDRGGRSYTFAIGNGASWDDGCCRNRDCGSVSCCGSDCSGNTAGDAGHISPGADAGSRGNLPACPQLRSREFNDGEQLLYVSEGSSERLRFHVDQVPAPSGLGFAELSMRLHDADHPGQEGRVFVNDQGPLSLPADPGWDDQDADATLAVPVAYLQAGTNLIEFGAGTRDTTHYAVSRLALTVYGSACATQPDAWVPQPDAWQPEPDAWTPEPDAWTPEPDAGVSPPDANTTLPDTAPTDTSSPPPDAGPSTDAATATDAVISTDLPGGEDESPTVDAGLVEDYGIGPNGWGCGAASGRGLLLVVPALLAVWALRRARHRPAARG